MSLIPAKYLPQLPPYWRENEAAFYHFSAGGEEAKRQREKRLEFGDQLLIPTATWGLDYWEDIFQVEPNPGDSYEQRRARIIAKYRKRNPFTTAEAIELTQVYVKPYGKPLVEISENPATGVFVITVPLFALLDLPGWIRDISKRKRVPHVFIPALTNGGNVEFVNEGPEYYLAQQAYCGAFASGGEWIL